MATSSTAPRTGLPASIDEGLLARLTGLIVSDGSSTYKLTEVYTGDLVCELPQSTPADVDRAYEIARVAQERVGTRGRSSAGWR